MYAADAASLESIEPVWLSTLTTIAQKGVARQPLLRAVDNRLENLLGLDSVVDFLEHSQ